MEPHGQEYTLESTNQRSTSIIIRKSPNNWTLMQRTASGLAVIELTEAGKAELIALLGGPGAVVAAWKTSAPEIAAFSQIPPALPREAAAVAVTPKRRGRRPKAA